MIRTTSFEDIQLSNHDIVNNVTYRIQNELMKHIENAFTEGLKRKGFEFKTPIELHTFMQERCVCKDNINLTERVYYIDNIPFLLHKYKSEFKITSEPYKIVSNLGTFVYL